MIVVRANLYGGHAERARRKLPKRRLAAAAMVLFGILLVSDLSEVRAVAAVRAQIAAAERHAAELARDLEFARGKDLALHAGMRPRDAVLAFAAQRRNWAPVLAEILAAVPPTVELISLQVEAPGSGKPSVKLAGKCTGAQPRLEADKCMLQVTHAFSAAGTPMRGRFVTLEDSQPGLIGDETRPRFASFLIHFTAGERRADE
jgi:hypothetical protein